MKKLLVLLLLLLALPALAEEPLPPWQPALEMETVAEHASGTLIWRIGKTKVDKTTVYVTTVWMADPGQQIGKATADWRKNVLPTADIAKREPGASLIINASGYVTRTYKWIPENYPGTNSDYYFTPLGSVTVTDGETFRCLEGVPYYGLTLNTDGLRLHVGEDPEAVLAQEPTQTWSFYVECPIIRDHQSILDPEWKFTNSKAMRTVIARIDANNYVILTVTSNGGGLTMARVVEFLMEAFDPEWAYNLDGGPSSALMYRDGNGKLHTVWKNGQANVDVMTFSELPQ
ncbi:MAG: phosphodiester glycosidase family protein [Clostridia bacterium]|nr:phosphodiester glycosidase family protein [Clostridia bacterium]